MSQAKVDRYKEEKANRKKNMQKAKYKSIAGKICAIAVCAVIVGWGGYSIYDRYEENKPTEYLEIDTTALDDYQTDMVSED